MIALSLAKRSIFSTTQYLIGKKCHFKVRRILLEWLPWLLMMSRPGTKYSCGEAFTVSETSSRTKEDEYNPFVEEVLSGRNASDAQILLLHQLYLKLKQVLLSGIVI